MVSTTGPNTAIETFRKAAKHKFGFRLHRVSRGSKALAAHNFAIPATVAQLPTVPFATAAAVERANVPLSLHLDHVRDADQIRTIAATMPSDSVMVDMSHHNRIGNLALTKELVKVSHDLGVAVEGEAVRIHDGEKELADTGKLEYIATSHETRT